MAGGKVSSHSRSSAPPTEPAASTAGGLPLHVRQLKIVFSARPPAARTVPLERDVVAIGRDPGPGGHVVLDDSQASRLHATVEPRDGGWIIVDKSSKNGTFVDGARVDSVPLAPGAVIRIGTSLIIYVEDHIAAGARLAPETPEIGGQSVAMQLVRGAIQEVAPHGLPVLVLGETGVGKELVARAIHGASGRSGPFVAVNCAAIPASLAESELFGHLAGAFTGATARTQGLFVAADRGTLFLDEVGELAPEIQPKLLRALATSEVRPIGATESRSVDVRIVAATLRPLGDEATRGAFRADLHARLASWTIDVPPLRARPVDILRLAGRILEARGSRATLSLRAAEALLLHRWPGNVRELEQALASAVIKAGSSGSIQRDHLPAEVAAAIPRSLKEPAPAAAAPLELRVDRDAVPSADELRLALERFGGNVAQVAAFFGKARLQVYRWMERHGIDPASFRKS
jgi:transcriptional regulator with GAF, ATPase, and Fis domain